MSSPLTPTRRARRAKLISAPTTRIWVEPWARCWSRRSRTPGPMAWCRAVRPRPISTSASKGVSGSPTYCNDDSALAIQQLNDLTTAHPDLNAVVAVGGWPLFVPEGYRNFFNSNADRFKSGKLVAVSADTLPSELQLLKGGYVAALVGQRPFEMGEKAMDALLALHDGKPVQQIIYTGVDRVTKDNVGEFLK